jgi:uncharacterized RDD family membrane protein YckC
MSRTGSVAPPGWSPPATSGTVGGRPPLTGIAALPPSLDRSRTPVPGVIGSPEAALRARMNAIVVDGVLVFLWSVLVGAVILVADVLPLAALPVVGLLVELVYFAAHERRDGRSPGKRHYGIKVVMVRDGSPPDLRAVLLRAALRPIDSIPLLYTSGLISLLRTGPERRQRIGDVLAGTVVVPAGDNDLSRRSPGWLLPSAVILSLLVSSLAIFGTIENVRSSSADHRQAFVDGCVHSGGRTAACDCLFDRLGERRIGELEPAVEAGDPRAITEIRTAALACATR